MQTPDRIEIISPVGIKGLGRQYKAAPQVADESNYVLIGALVINTDGSINNEAKVEVEATDAAQNKVMDGTGTQYSPTPGNYTYYYPFTYEFRTPGEHVITFKCNDIVASVKETAQ